MRLHRKCCLVDSFRLLIVLTVLDVRNLGEQSKRRVEYESEIHCDF